MIDARTQHDPAKRSLLVAQALAAADSQKELAARLDVSPRYLQLLAREERTMSYPFQWLLEAVAQEGGPEIDARVHHDPAKGASLAAQATTAAGSQKDLAARVGISVRYLQLLAQGERTNMSYALQAILVGIIREERAGR